MRSSIPLPPLLPLLRLVPALALVLLPQAAQAQQPKTSPVDLRLLSFNPGGGRQEVFLHDPAAQEAGDGVRGEVKSYLNHEALALNLVGRTAVLTTKAARASLNEAGAKIAKVALPADLRRGVLVLFPNTAGAEFACRALVIDDSPGAFPTGSLKIMNLSPLPVRLVLEKDTFDFKVGETKVIKDPPVRENNHTAMKAFCFQDNEWKRVASSLWPHPGSVRVFQFLFENPQTGKIELRGFRDVASVLSTAPAPGAADAAPAPGAADAAPAPPP